MSYYYGTGPAFDTEASARSAAAAPANYDAHPSGIIRFGSNTPIFEEFYLFRTGGNAALLIADVYNRSGSVTRLASQGTVSTAPNSPRRNTKELLGTIQSAFGLSITAMAAVLRVERPTIYAWLKETSTPTPANAARLDTVAKLADHWVRSAAGRQYSDSGRELVEGKSLNVLLRDEHLRTFVIERALSRAAKSIESEQSSGRLSIRELALQRGIKPSDSEDLDILTGRRLGPEE